MHLTGYLLFFLLFEVNTQRLEGLLRPFRIFKQAAFAEIKTLTESDDYIKLLRNQNKLQQVKNATTPFPCALNNARSKNQPQSVHELRPGDIDVIAGIGDSLTAGVGLMAMSILHVAIENRGMAPTAGGEGDWRGILTVPNLLKEFNPNLVGYATATSLTLQKESQFNLGETGTLSEDTPFMAKLLIKRMLSHPKVDMENHWKMITYMVGPNDFCSQICFHNNLTAVLENHRKDVHVVLGILKKYLPKTIVNIIAAPSMEILARLIGKPNICIMNHLLECPCIFGPRSKHHDKYFALMKNWQEIEREIANDEEFDSEDFTVVFQPFTVNFSIPKTPQNLSDFSYLSADCFHMSQKGNARIALSLWNNIFEPVGSKTEAPVDLGTEIKCPTEESPFIFTRRNSKSNVIVRKSNEIV